MKERFWIVFIFLLFTGRMISAQEVILGAERFDVYENLIRDKRLGLLVNQTSMVADNHLVDYLISREI